MSHEQSESIQRPDGKWINVYGRALPKAGQQLPGTPTYDTVDDAVSAAKARSASFDESHDDSPVNTPEVTVRPDPNDPNRGVTDPLKRRTELVGEGEAFAELERRAKDGGLSPRAQEALAELKRRKGIPDAPAAATPEPVPQAEGLVNRTVGLAATGFNKGLAGWVDLVNEGLKGMGLPMSDEPFMGSAFVDKYLAGAQFQPQNVMERVLQRAGLEVGANVPMLAGAGAVGAAGAATKAAGAEQTLTGTSQLDAIKNLPAAITQQLAEVSPTKLAALESMLAAGAGTGAEIVHELFPEGGKLGEFVGEVIGGFAPSVAIGMIRKAKNAAHSLGRVVLGMETDDETKRRVGKTLADAATPEQIDQGVKQAETLRQEVTPNAPDGQGLQLSAGSAIKGGSVSTTERAEAKASPKIGAKLKDQRDQNIAAVQEYFNATEPEGNPVRLVERLETERAKKDALLQLGLERTQAKVDAARGALSKQQAAVMDELESRMWRADQTVDARLQAIGPQLRAKQRGEVIRQAYQEELGKFRERSRADYAELDNLGHAELPVSSTLSKLADLDGQFPAQLQAIRKINPRVEAAIGNLGHDYELIQRVEKAQADLEIVGGKGKDQRGGFSMGVEQDGTGSTQRSIGIPSNYPHWYKTIANEKVAGTENVLDRETIEAALDTLKTGTLHGLHDKTLQHVKRAILADSEFRKSPWFEPVMDELANTPSASLKDLRQLRSDLLALSRQARSTDNRVQNYVLQEIIGAVDQDIDNLLPGTSRYSELYPDHGTLYRQVSADYRAGVETLMKGTANKIRRVRQDGSYAQDDESLPALFWKNETTMQEFRQAFPNQAMAKIALRDYALEDFRRATAKMVDGKLQLDPAAAREWLEQHGPQLQAFPDLEPTFRKTMALQEELTALKTQAEVFRQGQRGQERLQQRMLAERRPGDFTPADLAQAETRLQKVADLVARSKHDWEYSKAGLFLKQSPEVAASRIVLDKEPVKAYDEIVKQLKGDQEAIAGFNKAIWRSLTDTMQPKLIGVSGDVNLGVMHKTIQTMLEGYGGLMKKVLGPEGYHRMEVASEVIEKIATGSKAGSDTAINLQVHAALASSWLSRGWAALSGRVPMGFGAAERGAQWLIKTLQKHTAEQQEAILLEAFYNPKVFQTLVNAASYGPENALVKKQLAQHLHMLNLSEQMRDE